ncbi:hypothetical protein [Paracidovorax wautersii]|uniref:hypothetical protein n=1 Tax=Paracidovorax wautersii TaxID=1177982 RepID=UPI0011138CB6|nr:hypothetical protein [Paracidovorax wautersii]
MQFIVTLGGFVPAGFTILYALCLLGGLLMVVNAIWRQMDTARGRGDFTGVQNLGHALFGGVLAVSAELIGAYGKGIFGEFQSASVLLYVGQSENNLAKVAMGAFMWILQFIGATAFVHAIRLADRLSTGKPQPGESYYGVFWFGFAGLALVFIQQTLGLISGVTGMGLARFINNL